VYASGSDAVKIPAISIIVPCRVDDSPELTLGSLAKQTFQDYSVHVVTDHRKQGAPWARNFGLEQEDIKTPYVLFSDADIQWEKDALEKMVRELQENRRDVGFAYGGYYLQEPTMFKDKFRTFSGPIGNQPWDFETLLNHNYISTMSLIRREALCELGPKPWDESLKRLQDWDLWLNLAQRGWKGVWVGGVTFTTPIRKGLSFADTDGTEHNMQSEGITYNEAYHIVRVKHGL